MKIQSIFKNFHPLANHTQQTPRVPDSPPQHQQHTSIALINLPPKTQQNRDYFSKCTFEPTSQHVTDRYSIIDEIQAQSSHEKKRERIDSEIDEIEEMKVMFGRKFRDGHCSSVDRNQQGRSNQRHLLKPCPVPRIKNTSEFTTRPTLDLKQAQSQKRDQERDHFSRFEDISFKQEAQSQQHSSISHEAESAEYSQEQSSSNHLEIRQQTGQCPSLFPSNLQSKAIYQQTVSIDTSKPLTLRTPPQDQQNCDCHLVLKDFMQEMRQKVSVMGSKMAKMQKQNSALRNRYEMNQIRNQELNLKVKDLQRQRDSLLQAQSHQTVPARQRVQMGPCLREVQVSNNEQDKQNREEDVIIKKVTRGSIEKKLQEREASTDRRTSGKMETLLQRLQLRIQRA